MGPVQSMLQRDGSIMLADGFSWFLALVDLSKHD